MKEGRQYVTPYSSALMMMIMPGFLVPGTAMVVSHSPARGPQDASEAYVQSQRTPDRQRDEEMEEANRLITAGELQEGTRRLEALLKREAAEENSRWAGDAYCNLGYALAELGRWAEAVRAYRRSIEISRKLGGDENPDLAQPTNNLALIYTAMGRHREADALLRRGIELFARAFGQDHPVVAVAMANLAESLRRRKRLDEAEAVCRQALSILEKQSVKPAQTGEVLVILATLHWERGRRHEAATVLEEAVRILGGVLGPSHFKMAAPLSNLGFLYQELGEYSKAQAAYEGSLAVYEAAAILDHHSAGLTLRNYAELLTKMKRKKEANAMRAWAGEILRRHSLVNQTGHTVDFSELAERKR